MTLNSKVYDFLKPIALVWLPALATLYFALAGIWGFPDATQVIGSITALDGVLGGILHLSSSSYSPGTNGNLVVDKSNPAKDVYSLEISTPMSQLSSQSSITLNIVPKKT